MLDCVVAYPFLYVRQQDFFRSGYSNFVSCTFWLVELSFLTLSAGSSNSIAVSDTDHTDTVLSEQSQHVALADLAPDARHSAPPRPQSRSSSTSTLFFGSANQASWESVILSLLGCTFCWKLVQHHPQGGCTFSMRFFRLWSGC